MAPGELGSRSTSPRRDTGETDMEMNTLQDGTGTSELADGSQPGLESNEVIDDETTVGKVLDLAARDDTAEPWEVVEKKAQEAQYTYLSKELFEKEKTKGDLRRRSKQAIIHVTFTEIRITQLEEELRKLKAKIEDRPDDFKLSEKKKQCPVHKPVLERSVYDEFRLTPHSTDVPIHQRPSLEVLVTDHIPHLEMNKDPQKLPRRSTGLVELYGGNVTARRTPERLRIRSLPLIAHLERICRETLSNHRVWADKPEVGAPAVLLRPFKLLFVYEQEIKESVQEVEALLQSAEQGDEGDEVKKGTFMNQEFKYKDLLQDLKLLIEFYDVDLKPTFDLRQNIRDGTAINIDYADLWHLFEVGDVVITRSNRAQAFRVVNFTGGRDKLINRLPEEKDKKQSFSVDGFVVDCVSICFDGTDYVPKLNRFSIRKFIGNQPITSLEVYPLKFDKNSNTMRQEFVSQGRKYLDLTRSPFSHKMFKGNTLDEPSQELDAQVIVDITLAVSTEPDWRPSRRVTEEDLTASDARETVMRPFCEHSLFSEGCCGSDYIFKDLDMNHSKFTPSQRDHGGLFGPRDASELKEEDLILLPNWVHGFVLRSRQWVTLKMADLSEVQFENDFDELMFSDSHKQTILALVKTHENGRTASPTDAPTVGAALDLVKGKGTGLILLLHGEPGVGKTSTAECVADKTKRPLFPITCGDIGETAMEVERNLHHNFRLAHKWGCVLLLDEADVFLAKRNKTDLRRNAVTSVFLRSLEYYAGILFLTTNRVGGIDPAFKSRINLSLYYPRLDLDTTLKLHKVFLGRAKAEQKKRDVALFRVKEKEILRFAKRHYRQLKKENFNTWNGRQIRNAFQTAIALVEHEAAQNEAGQPKPILGKAQFEIVAQGSKEFDSYLMKTLQGADDEIAIRDQWRDDRFDAGVVLTSSKSKPAQKVSRADFQSVRNSESDSTSTEDESESEDEDGDEDEDDDTMEVVPKAGASSKAESKEHTDSGIDFNEYEEFLRFKAMLKGKGKKT